MAAGVPPKMLGMLVQVEGDRAYLARHLVFEDAETKVVDGRTAYLSDDGYWCSWIMRCASAPFVRAVQHQVA
ncbi:hypothetical protein [Kutzneria albida]|uniref:Uncharacterized protein n=1 Tax=Kutzneria albida DSM 43870 TaxID=1449976 RepID=W5W0J7_9PSEU|nr:hypothetical protein [Kutzneria albida]AHH94076.1 hypothetical protein KALB_701 [Kutzneria albida DSM 43870]